MFRKLFAGALLMAFTSARDKQTASAEIAAKTALEAKQAEIKTQLTVLSNKKLLLVAATTDVTEAFHAKNGARQVWEELKENVCATADADTLSCATEAQITTAEESYKQAQLFEQTKIDDRKTASDVVKTEGDALKVLQAARKSAQQAFSAARLNNDEDIDFESVENGSEGIPGGTGGGSNFDLSQFTLDDEVGGRRTPAQIQAQIAKELETVKRRVGQIKGWYAKQRENALKGVYSPTMMKTIRGRHSDRIKRARAKIEGYKKAVELRYLEYKKLYKNRSINADQYKNVGKWRRENIKTAKKNMTTFKAEVKQNWQAILNRNEIRQENRRTRLEEAREEAIKQIEEVRRAWKKKDEKLQLALRRPANENYGNDDIFGSLFGDD